MTDAPDELESAMILGDPQESVSLDTIKAMARAVRDAGWVRPTDEVGPHEHTWEQGIDSVVAHCHCGSTRREEDYR